jgi:phosphate transport system substrate-binding protein
MIYKDMSTVIGETQDKSTEVINFLNWILHDGQQYSSGLLYVPLPDSVKKIGEDGLAKVTFTGGTVPEFGPIAALVLAIAIVSIIAISSKTGLKFSPKF